MPFTHPLARAAKAWAATTQIGTVRRMLVVVTTLELDPKSKKYKKKLIESLASAANEYVAANPKEASGFIFINRLRDWTPSGPESRKRPASAA
jgi:hypothetical protein